MSAILLRGRLGLGDCIYQRAVVREVIAQHDHVYLETPWPQLVADLPVKCCPRATSLRTQTKNAARRGFVWRMPPAALRPKVIGYAASKGSILQGLCDSAGVAPASVRFDLPAFPAPDELLPGPDSVVRRPYIVVRPATIRAEWPAAARNPQADYIARAAAVLRRNFDIVSVADLEPNAEWAVGTLPMADATFHRGELSIEQVLALVHGAAGCIGGVGWLVPAAVAYRRPLFLIYGGGANDRRDRIFDPRMPTGKVTHAIPDRYCLCNDRQHACDKRISGFDAAVERWAMERIAGCAPAMASRNRGWLLPSHRQSL